MNKQITRAFALGLLAAALALFVYQEATDIAPPTEKAMIHKLEENNFVVQTAKEAARQKQEKEKLQQQLNQLTAAGKEPSSSEKNQKNTNEEPYRLSIKPGMTSFEISQQLEKARIIKDRHTFNNYLTENGYAEKLQIGEHPLYPSMTMKEMAIVLTAK